MFLGSGMQALSESIKLRPTFLSPAQAEGTPVLLRYNSLTTQFTHSKCAIQWFLVSPQNWASSQSILEHCHHLAKKSWTLLLSHPYSPCPGPKQPLNLLAASIDFSTLDISNKWSHTVRELLHLASFTEHDVFKVAAFCTLFLRMLSIHSSVAGDLSSFYLLATINNAYLKTA